MHGNDIMTDTQRKIYEETRWSAIFAFEIPNPARFASMRSISSAARRRGLPDHSLQDPVA